VIRTNAPPNPRWEAMKNRLPVLRNEKRAAELAGKYTFLTVTPGGHPLANAGGNLPWLAFCSGRYLRTPGRVIPLTGADIRHVPESFGFTDKTEVFADELGLPRSVELFVSTERLRSAWSHESLLRDGRVREQPRRTATEGALAARYLVLQHTNFAGWNVPTLFSYEQFKRDGSKAITVRAFGSVTDIRLVDMPASFVSATGLYSVVDYRFRDREKVVDEIHYSITNGTVEPATSPELKRLFNSQAAVAPIDPNIKLHD